jgi:hypothetical protein
LDIWPVIFVRLIPVGTQAFGGQLPKLHDLFENLSHFSEEIMLPSPLLPRGNQESPLPAIGIEDESNTMLEFVRALAIRQAHRDASRGLTAANDNHRGTIH